jgi:ferrous iron transport protein A
MMPLGLLSPGEKGEIMEIRLREPHCSCSARNCGEEREKTDIRVEDMGLRIGKTVEILNNGGGPVLLMVDESRLAVARGIAMKIMVRRTQ